MSVNNAETPGQIDTRLTQPRSRPVRDVHEERRRRQARALEVVKAIRPKQIVVEPSHTELVGDEPNPTGVVYFAYCADRIKIGYTAEISNRMAGLATNSPFPVTLLMTITGTIETEAEFHRRFADQRLHLEWFRFDDDLMWFLFARLCDEGNARMIEAMLDYHPELATDE